MEVSSEQRLCTRQRLRHRCCHNIFFHHHDWRVFAYSALLPFRKPYQVLYLIYRWFLALYFLIGLVYSIKQSKNYKYVVYLTNWTFVTLNCYLLVSAFTVTATLVGPCIATLVKQLRKTNELLLPSATPPSPQQKHFKKAAKWYHMIQGPLFVVGNEMSFMVVIFYWIMLSDGDRVSFNDVNVHIINGIIALVDLWVSGVPLRLLHVIYPILYGAIYIVFTGIYYSITGLNIYKAMDYREKPLKTSLLNLATLLVIIPFLHVFVFYFQYKVKQDILTCITLKCRKKKERLHDDESQIEENKQDSQMLALTHSDRIDAITRTL